MDATWNVVWMLAFLFAACRIIDMKLLDIPGADRTYLTSLQSFALDAQGQEILVGLTREESEGYLSDSISWIEQRVTGTRSKADKLLYSELNEKHEVARLRGIGLTNLKPQGNA